MVIYDILISLLIGYCFGLVHPAYILGKAIKGIDIRNGGSNNSGASNATVVLGWKYGVITALIDILKGTLAILVGRYILHYNIILLYIIGFGVIIGHDFPFYMNFKGGKGTASVIGVFLGINPIIGLLMGITIILITVITDYIVIGTIAIHIVAVILTFINYPMVCTMLVFLLTLLTISKHWSNMIKIKNKTEIGLRSTLKKKR
ncbi:glycerol-3-phosphate acyltransferase [Clostridium tunisiense]|uniref:glycerol-3-phosphate acyltransferase n=1 Tax=Clostridium tunisiense TaxID=219748 RepID=UPI00031F6EB6|nr:glycerol-3-phosphate acyltransferase [Clostridium tunisiense]